MIGIHHQWSSGYKGYHPLTRSSRCCATPWSADIGGLDMTSGPPWMELRKLRTQEFRLLEAGVRRQVKGSTHRVAVLLVLSALLVLVPAVASAERLVLVPLDSCGYEVATALVERELLDAVVVSPALLNGVDPHRSKVAVLAIVPNTSDDRLRGLGDILYASTDVLDVRAERIVLAADLTAYCLYGDFGALLRIARTLKTSNGDPLLQSGAVLVAVTVAAVATISLSSREAHTKFRDLTRRIFTTLSTVLSLLMARKKLGYEEVLGHPIRLAILDVLKTRGEADFSELMRHTKTSRANLEWHLWVLKTRGLVVEIKSGGKRIYRLRK